MTGYWFLAVSVAIFVVIGSSQAANTLEGKELAFLQQAAREQLAEIALGRLAMKKASDKKLKELGSEIAEDHQYASREITEISAKEKIYLPVELDAQQKQAHRRLSRLSGHEFDKAFIAYLVNKHRNHIKELQAQAATLENENAKQWAEATEPILAVHLKKAEHVAHALTGNTRQ